VRALAIGLALLAAAGCGTFSGQEVQRVTEGPTAEEIFSARFVAGYKRPPTFDETTSFRADMDQRIGDYFARRPDLAATPRASELRSARRVSVGMFKDEVLLLAGEPLADTRDPAAMRAAARDFWPAVQGRAQEMWIYPGNWQFFFSGDQLVDLTYVGPPPR
jgi:hypothetical protein